MLTPIQEAILVCICLGVPCICVSRIINRTLVSACSVFWVAWTGFLLAAWYSEFETLIPAISERSTQLVELGLVGAAIGCLVGSLLAGRIHQSPPSYQESVDLGISPRVFNLGVAAIAATGVIYFAETLAHVGWNLQTILFDIRIKYTIEGLTPLGKLSQYFMCLVLPLAISLARRDAATGIRIMPIIWLTLACVPNGFATGGRGYLITPMSYYALAYMTATRGQAWLSALRKTLRIPRRKVLWRVGVGFLVFAVVFTLLGEWRWGTKNERPLYLRAVDAVLEYPATAITSVFEYSDVYAESATHGRLLLEWPAIQLERLGILSTDTPKEEAAARRDVRIMYGDVNNCPPTIIAYLIGDFGHDLMPAYFAVLMALSQIVTVRLNLRGFIAHYIVTMTLSGAVFSISGNMFFESDHCLGLIWAGVMVLYTRRRPQFSQLKAFSQGSYSSIRVESSAPSR